MNPSIKFHNIETGGIATFTTDSEILRDITILLPYIEGRDTITLASDEQIDQKVSDRVQFYADTIVANKVTEEINIQFNTTIVPKMEEMINNNNVIIDQKFDAVNNSITLLQEKDNELTTSITNVNSTLTLALETERNDRINADNAITNELNTFKGIMTPKITDLERVALDVSKFLSTNPIYSGDPNSPVEPERIEVPESLSKTDFTIDDIDSIKEMFGEMPDLREDYKKELLRKILNRDLSLTRLYERTTSLDSILQFLYSGMKAIAKTSVELMPTGSIITLPYDGNNNKVVRDNYLKLDGSAVSLTKYPELAKCLNVTKNFDNQYSPIDNIENKLKEIFYNKIIGDEDRKNIENHESLPLTGLFVIEDDAFKELNIPFLPTIEWVLRSDGKRFTSSTPPVNKSGITVNYQAYTLYFQSGSQGPYIGLDYTGDGSYAYYLTTDGEVVYPSSFGNNVNNVRSKYMCVLRLIDTTTHEELYKALLINLPYDSGQTYTDPTLIKNIMPGIIGVGETDSGYEGGVVTLFSTAFSAARQVHIDFILIKTTDSRSDDDWSGSYFDYQKSGNLSYPLFYKFRKYGYREVNNLSIASRFSLDKREAAKLIDADIFNIYKLLSLYDKLKNYPNKVIGGDIYTSIDINDYTGGTSSSGTVDIYSTNICEIANLYIYNSKTSIINIDICFKNGNIEIYYGTKLLTTYIPNDACFVYFEVLDSNKKVIDTINIPVVFILDMLKGSYSMATTLDSVMLKYHKSFYNYPLINTKYVVSTIPLQRYTECTVKLAFFFRNPTGLFKDRISTDDVFLLPDATNKYLKNSTTPGNIKSWTVPNFEGYCKLAGLGGGGFDGYNTDGIIYGYSSSSNVASNASGRSNYFAIDLSNSKDYRGHTNKEGVFDVDHMTVEHWIKH